MRHQACRPPYSPTVVTGPMRGTFRWFENAGMRTAGPTVIDEVVLAERGRQAFPRRRVVDVKPHAPLVVAGATSARSVTAPGGTGYVMEIELEAGKPMLYVKLELGSGRIFGRSFHYSER